MKKASACIALTCVGFLATGLISAKNSSEIVSTSSVEKLSSKNKLLGEKIFSIAPDNLFHLDGKTYIRSGDMLLLVNSDNDSRKIESTDNKQYKNRASKYHINKFDISKSQWSDGKVYYQFDDQVIAENRQRFIEATEIWSSIAKLEFIERTDQPNYIYVQNDSRNYATVGMVGGKQILSMVNWGSLYVIVHELGHSLGMWHEQQRSDRDQFVDIHLDNVKDGMAYNFSKHATTDYGEYDFMSVMHYDLYAYSKNGQRTIEPKSDYQAFVNIAGQRSYISGGDQLNVASQYGAKKLSFTDTEFKRFLVSQFDTDGDGEINSIEALNVTSIKTPGEGKISSLSGIENFRYLENLDVSNENIEILEKLPNRLKSLKATHNQLDVIPGEWSFLPLISSIDISGNFVDVYSCESLEFLSNKIGSDNLVINPVADGSHVNCNGDSRWGLINGKPRKDLRSKGSQIYHIDVPQGAKKLEIRTSNFEGKQGGLMDLFVSHGRQPSNSDSDYRSTNSANEEYIEIQNPQAGIWYVTLEPSERSFEYVDLVATYSLDSSTDNILTNNEPLNSLSATQGETIQYLLDVPALMDELVVTVSGGTGDADLYVRFGEAPTLTEFDCRPWINGNSEVCTIQKPKAGRYFIHLVGYQSFENVTLKGAYTKAKGGGSYFVSDMAGLQGEWRYFPIDIPFGTSKFDISLLNGSGDSDLYVRYGAYPSAQYYYCRPYLNGNNESCSFVNPQAGTWYIGVYAFRDFSGLDLNAKWSSDGAKMLVIK
ncbi:pre-peptidase C-terminal domain-containing protein [Aliikangiella coralliicola]|uniref:Peptidase M12A domain-containing protein n=1 Tax=Aliikangiella coralliicola TaxID=2592383 RepID=A0A545UAQ2_9GAMM|nr:pre-peptidase C-terminal domain-containing protein [Aliikangiella coralliicola]TQV86538.1 hypothetical protein FLL46_16670 [Aliikangiella coralliicola]